MREFTVAISGINAADNPGPGIGVARSLKEDPELAVRTIGLAYDAMEPGVYLDWILDCSCTIPFPSNGGAGLLERLLDIKNRHGLDVVIPTLDAELPFYIKYRGELARHGIATFLPTMDQFRLRGKDHLGDIADEIGIRIPKTEVIFDEAHFYEALENIGYPVMVKGIYYGASAAWTAAEAVGHYRRIVAEWGYPIILQEKVSGDELNVIGLGDGEGTLLGQVGIKKITTTSLGKVWSAVTVKHPAVMQAAEEFVERFSWRGPFELECIVSGDDVWLIELNPRFPAWVYFATGVGVNLPSQLIRRCLDLPVSPVPVSEWETGKLFMRYTYELVTDLHRFQTIMMQGETL